jgi:hypothetical protein
MLEKIPQKWGGNMYKPTHEGVFMNSHKTLLAMITAALAVTGFAQACAPCAATKSAAASKETAHTLARKAAKAGDFYEAINIIVSGYNAKKIGLDPAYANELYRTLLAVLNDETAEIYAEELIAGCDVLAKGSFVAHAKKCRALLAARSGDSVRRPRHASAAAANDCDSVLGDSAPPSVLDGSVADESVNAILDRSVVNADAAADVVDESVASEASVSAHVASPAAVAARQARAAGAAAAVSDTVRAPNAQAVQARLAQLHQERAALAARLEAVQANASAAAASAAAAPAAPAGARDLLSFVRANPNPRGNHRAPSAPAAATATAK